MAGGPGGPRAARRMLKNVLAVVMAGAAVVLPASAAQAAAPQASTEQYGATTRKNEAIVMNDGTTLRANVTVPTDPDTGEPARGQTFPVVLTETAYGKDVATYAADFSSLLGTPEYFAKRGYVAVMVDVRGTGTSEGQWTFNDPQEAQDSVEVINWTTHLPESNGKVGMVGASYLGITQLFAAAEIGPRSPLKAIVPMIASNSIFREAVMPGGLLDTEGVAMYLALTGVLNSANPVVGSNGDPASLIQPTLDHLAGLLQFHVGTTADALGNGPRAEDGTFWRARGPERILDKVVRNGIPAYLVGGFDDAFQSGVFRNYVGLQNAWAGRPTTAPMRKTQKVTPRYQALVGPWFHAGIGKGGPDLNELALKWFDRWLKGVKNGVDKTRFPMRLIERDRKERPASRWPLPTATARAFNLAPGGRLSTATPDPGTTTLAFTGVSLPCQRTTEIWLLGLGEAITDAIGLPEPCRDSALQPPLPAPATQTFTTEPMTKATTIAGPITAQVTLSSTTPDAEVIAKVYDVDPGGTAREITSGGLLASARATDGKLSWNDPKNGLRIYPHHPITHAAKQPLTPGTPTRLEIEVLPTVHTFKPGHALRVVLATGEFPARFPLPADLPNLLGGIYTVSLGGDQPSRLIAPVLPR